PRQHGDVFHWQAVSSHVVELRFGKRAVARYVYEPLDETSEERRMSTALVFHHLFDPQGNRLLTKGYGGNYPHHPGGFYGFRDVTYEGGKHCNVWAGKPGNGYQAHESVLATAGGPVLGRHRVALAWRGPNKELFAREEREITVYNVHQGVLVELASRLRA